MKNRIQLPARVRTILYVLTAVGSPIIAYLGTEGRLDDFYVGLFAVIVTAVNALALSNITPDKK